MAIRVFGMRYPEYMGATSPAERTLYRLFLGLEQAKERHRAEQREIAARAEREAHAAVPNYRSRT